MNKRQIAFPLIVIAVAFFLITACSGSSSAIPPEDQISTVLALTEIASTPQLQTSTPNPDLVWTYAEQTLTAEGQLPPASEATARPSLTSGLTPTATATLTPICADLDLTDPRAQDLLWVYQHGYIQDPSGCSPTLEVTQREMALWVCNALYTEPLETPMGFFGDINEEQEPELAACVEQLRRDGIVRGCTETAYCPNRRLKLVELAVFHLKFIYGSDWEPPAVVGQPWGVYDEAWQQAWGEFYIRNGFVGLATGRWYASTPATRLDVAPALRAAAGENR